MENRQESKGKNKVGLSATEREGAMEGEQGLEKILSGHQLWFHPTREQRRQPTLIQSSCLGQVGVKLIIF